MNLGNCVGVGTNQIVCTGWWFAPWLATPINARLSGIATALSIRRTAPRSRQLFLGLTLLGAPPWAPDPEHQQQALDFSWNGVALIGAGTVTVTVSAGDERLDHLADRLSRNEPLGPSAHYSVSPGSPSRGPTTAAASGPGPASPWTARPTVRQCSP
jgi:hypothetical protein